MVPRCSPYKALIFSPCISPPQTHVPPLSAGVPFMDIDFGIYNPLENSWVFIWFYMVFIWFDIDCIWFTVVFIWFYMVFILFYIDFIWFFMAFIWFYMDLVYFWFLSFNISETVFVFLGIFWRLFLIFFTPEDEYSYSKDQLCFNRKFMRPAFGPQTALQISSLANNPGNHLSQSQCP